MALTLDRILTEIRDVADRLNIDTHKLTRAQWRREAHLPPDCYERFGSWTAVRSKACNDSGDPSHGRDIAEAQCIADERAYVRRLERDYGRAVYSTDRLRTALSDALSKYPIKLSDKPRKWQSVTPTPPKRVLNLCWSDLHFGQLVDPREVPGCKYDWQIASRRLAKCVAQAIEWKPHHRDVTDLTVLLNGDIIEGVIHQDDSGTRLLTEQIVGTTQILVGALDALRQHFRRIDVRCTPGNHGRRFKGSGGRALAQRWDAYETLIYHGLVQAFRGVSDVGIEIPRSAVVSYETPGGHRTVVQHGDTAPSVSNVGKAINVERIRNRLNDMIVSAAFGPTIDVYVAGHWHTPLQTMLPNGSTLIVNGCLIGGSPYSQHAINSWAPVPAQLMWESVPGYPVGDVRIVQVKDADENSAYDELIATPSLELDSAA